jgi:hypothetical protein
MSTGTPPWSLEFEPEEAWLLGVLLDFYQPLVEPDAEPLGPDDGDGDAGSGDAEDSFAFWESDVVETTVDRQGEDPALVRLFPDAYSDDPLASAEFRRFTLSGQRRERLDDIAMLRRALVRLADGPLPIGVEDIDPWLRVANALRLLLASRLGIVDDRSADQAERDAHRDPSDIIHPAYEWLGVLIEIFIEVSWGED